MAYTALIPLIIVAIIIFRLRNVGRRPKNYPPGPPTMPIIGNLHQMPQKNPHHQFKKWAEEYGPVFSLILGTKTMIVLSTDKAVKDLLDKRSNIYSSRTELYLGNLVSGYLRVLLMQYGETWRMIRKIMHAVLHINASKGYVPYQDLECKQMLFGVLEEPNLFADHIRRFTNSLTTQMVFGFRTINIHDENLLRLYEYFEKWSQVMGSGAAAFLDVYPILRKLPDFMLPMRRYAKELHRKEKALYVGHWMDTKKKILQGTAMVRLIKFLKRTQKSNDAQPCFSVGVAEGQKSYGFSDDLAGYIVGSLHEAGSDTTASTLHGFVQAMVLYPSAQKQAQAELDKVCGTERMPNIDDWDSLPYIRTCVKETLRWLPTGILGIPHCVIQDDEYMGYKIPKGAGVMCKFVPCAEHCSDIEQVHLSNLLALDSRLSKSRDGGSFADKNLDNVWAINMDENRFKNPRAFEPSRYEGDNQTSAESTMNSDPSQRDHFVFGAGRRVCQGMHIADRSLFLSISRLLWAFNFEKATDAQGREIVPDKDDLTEGFLVQPSPFPAKITPRSEKHAEAIRKEWDECQTLLDESKQWKEVPKGMVLKAPVPSELKD